MRKGRVTIPTDENYVEGTKKIAELWGADAVRDCDGTHLPKNALEIADKVSVQLLDSNTDKALKDRIIKDSTKDNLFAALDLGFTWLERNLAK